MTKKKRTLEDLLNFVNRASIESSLSWVIPHLYDKKVIFEIQWVEDKTTKVNFLYKKKSESSWSQVASNQLITALNKEKANLDSLEYELLKTICVQAACSHYYIERAGELVGKDSIDNILGMIENHNKNTSKNSKTPRLRLIRKDKNKNE